jgi:hypothetical protein
MSIHLFTLAPEFLALAALVIVAYALLLVALKRTGGLHRGVAAIGAPLLLILLAGGSLLAQRAEDMERARLVRMIGGLAPTYARFMADAGHAQVSFQTDAHDPTYLGLIELQKKLLAANPGVADIYTLRRDAEHRWRFVVDSETDYDHNGKFEGEREERTPIGTLYDAVDSFDRAELGENSFDPEPYTDDWGTWVSAAVPIPGPNGTVDGVLGVDFPADDWLVALAQARRTPLWMTAAVCSLTLAGTAVIATMFRALRTRRALEAQLREAAQAAQDASRAKSDFLANMSHEIRTPMTAILGYGELLRDPELTRQQFLDHVESLQSNGRHLLALISDILDFSKIEARAMTLERIDVDLDALLGEVKSIILLRAQQKHVRFTIEIDDDAPTTIQGDPTRLRQVLINLAGNAVKFTPAGGQVTVLAAYHPASHGLRITVRDTGIGMSREQIDKLFTAFMQADASTTRKFGGTGLGLSISKRLVELMNGSLQVRSEPGKGSEFIATIEGCVPRDAVVEHRSPRREALRALSIASTLEQTASAPPTTKPVELPPAPPRPRGLLAGLHVLIADDGADNRALVSYHLRKAGATVACAEDGRQAIDAIGESLAHFPDEGTATTLPFDAVILDMQMPELSGTDVARQARTIGYTGPIVALTADVLDSTRSSALAAGCDAFATKPIDSPALLATVANLTRPAARRAA